MEQPGMGFLSSKIPYFFRKCEFWPRMRFSSLFEEPILLIWVLSPFIVTWIVLLEITAIYRRGCKSFFLFWSVNYQCSRLLEDNPLPFFFKECVTYARLYSYCILRGLSLKICTSSSCPVPHVVSQRSDAPICHHASSEKRNMFSLLLLLFLFV